MAKRMQEQEGEDRIVAKSKPTLKIGLYCLDKFFDCAEPGCVEKPQDTQKYAVEQIG